MNPDQLETMIDTLDLPVVELPEDAYWREYVKGLLREPRKRLSLALDHLPEPKAFAEAVTALRTIIKDKQRAKQDIEPELALMYRLAAIDSFLFDTPEIEGVGLAEEIFLDVPPEAWAWLEMPYDSLGYQKFRLLTRADGKLLRQKWGQPEKQQSAQKYHLIAWEDAVEEYIDKHGMF